METDCLIYKGLRLKIKGRLGNAKTDFFLEIIRQAKGNTNMLWKSIDQLIGNECPKSGPGALRLN